MDPAKKNALACEIVHTNKAWKDLIMGYILSSQIKPLENVVASRGDDSTSDCGNNSAHWAHV